MTYLNEDTLVQQTTADYLRDKLGWESVYAYNQETFGPDGLLGRNSDREVVLTRYLKQALKEINKGLPETAYDEAVRQVVDYSQSQSMLASNFDKYKLFKDGVLVSFQGEQGEIKITAKPKNKKIQKTLDELMKAKKLIKDSILNTSISVMLCTNAALVVISIFFLIILSFLFYIFHISFVYLLCKVHFSLYHTYHTSFLLYSLFSISTNLSIRY